jgi:predicted ribonuclease YlaK
VVEELDEKKYGQRDDLAGRARGLLGGLRTLLAPTAGAPVRIRDGVTVEVPVDDTPRRRLRDADQEILNVCLDLKAVGRRVVLVTDDAGITLRAAACKIEVVAMPEKYLRVASRADVGNAPDCGTLA